MGDLLEKLPQSLADFLDFLARFASSPKAALAADVPADSRDAKVSGRLVGFVMLSALVAAALFQTGSAIGMAADRSRVVLIVGAITADQLPLVAALAIAALTISWHALARFVGFFMSLALKEVGFSGTLPASINAGLALGAFYTVATALLLVLVRLLAPVNPDLPAAVIGAAMALSLAFVWHVVAALAAVHRLTLVQSFTVVAYTVVLIGLAVFD